LVSCLNIFLLLSIELVPKFGWFWNNVFGKIGYPQLNQSGFLLNLRELFQKPKFWNDFKYNKNSKKKKESKNHFKETAKK
jgi:hypothetical protein